MRPDPHKQAASRKYHNKVKSRGGGTAGATADSTTNSAGHRGGRGGRGGGRGRGGYRGRSNGNEEEDDIENDDQDGESAPRKSYARRKIVSNADRYIEKDEEITEAEELEQGIDRQTLAFKEMLKDSDQKKTFDPAAYFRFKSEKEVDAQNPLEESQQSRKLLEIRLDDIEKALMTISIKDRLYLRESDVNALNRDMVGKVSLSKGKPIVPKLVRGQAASDILIKSPTNSVGVAPSASISANYSNALPGSAVSKHVFIDDDLDDLLDITKTYGRAKTSNLTSSSVPSKITSPSNATTPSPSATRSNESSSNNGSKIRLPPLSKGNKTPDASGNTTSKGLQPPKKGLSRTTGKKDEEWLDSGGARAPARVFKCLAAEQFWAMHPKNVNRTLREVHLTKASAWSCHTNSPLPLSAPLTKGNAFGPYLIVFKSLLILNFIYSLHTSMSATSLSRRSGIRAPSGTPRGHGKINPNALPRPKQTTIFDYDTEYGSSNEQSLASISTTSAQVQDSSEGEIEIFLEREDIYTRLFDDNFTRAYRPDYNNSAPANIGSNGESGTSDSGMGPLSPNIERQRPNTMHQDSIMAGKNIYDYFDHGFPNQQSLSPNIGRALSRSMIPPRGDSMESLYNNGVYASMSTEYRNPVNDERGIRSPTDCMGVVEELEEDEDQEDYSENESELEDDFNPEYIRKFQLQDTPMYELQEHSQNYQIEHIKRSPPHTPAAPRTLAPRSGLSVSTGPVKHYTPEIETQETLKRERTRIMQRTVVSSYRQIDYKDITNIQPLKKGGFGEIHTAEWSRLKVVLKRALLGRGEGLEQFDQELEILKRVHDYDFIVPFYGVTTDPITNVKCMVMKHCTNGNLCSFLEKNHATLSWEERYRLSIEITKGLEFLHKSGFHHRDLHSGNILLDDKRTAMICDFGLSRSSNKSRTSGLAAAVGVASFLAPERFPAKRPIYSAACDIYSLGVIFWHISSGRIPFESRLRDPMLLRELMNGRREEIVPGTPQEYTDMLVKCWDINPSRRPKIDVVIAILQTLMAITSEPLHVPKGFTVPSNTSSASLPVPPELETKMANLERANNTLNRMVFGIKNPTMRDTVKYIERTRTFFREQKVPAVPYSSKNPPKTPIYLCPLVGDIAGLNYHLSLSRPYNPINESSEQTGDTALHLACLFLESPLDTIKVLVELGADINLENLQGYTPVMILASSNTQYCYEALKYFVVRGARIPAYVRKPITPMDNAHAYALNLVNESKQVYLSGTEAIERRRPRYGSNTQNEIQGRRRSRFYSQGRPLIHVVAAMQDDYRILDCLCEAGLDPAVSFGGETALVAAAAHLKIKNVEWLLNNDLDISTEVGIARATKVVRSLYLVPPMSPTEFGRKAMPSASSKLDPMDFPDDIRDLGKYSWAGVAYSDSERFNKDMVGPVLQLLEQWTGARRIESRKEVATKLKLIHGTAVRTDTASQLGAISPVAVSTIDVPYIPPPPPSNTGKISSNVGPGSRQLSLRKNQRHLIDHVLNDKAQTRFR
ncbi:hypothetical protein BGZ46_004068 [Entomortierella lignicola]|nr:hypothetical protein BGZ46_004068 [Entomortierella lignicola]